MMASAENERQGALKDQLRFETLLTDISAQFINLPPEKIDSVIEDSQRSICEYLAIDLSALWQWSAESPRFLTVTHLYTIPGGPPRPERIDAQKSFPWVLDKVMNGETLVLPTENMPPEAALDQKSRRYFGVRSSVVIPLTAGADQMIGVLTFDTLKEERDWSVGTVQRLKLVGQIFCNALLRKESDRNLRESETRLKLSADSAGAGLWELNCDTSVFWTTEKALAIFGYDPDEAVDMQRFEQSVHPDDLQRVKEVISRSFARHEPLNVEYRILTDNDTAKWIYSSGHPYFKSDGEPDRLLGVSIDITERKAYETQLAMSEERMASAIDVAGLGFYEMVEEYHVRFLDDRMREIIGIPPEAEAHARQFWLEHIHQEDLPRVADVTRKVLEEGVDHLIIDYRYMHPESGTIWIHHLSRVLQRDAAGRATHVIGVVQDITESKRMEETLRESESILLQNQKDLQRLAGGLISLKEGELRRLSRELHDDLTQRLAVLAIDAGKLELHLKNSAPSLPEAGMVTGIKEQLIRISEDVHRISRQLHPTILEDLGLIRALKSECDALEQREGLEINFIHGDVPDRLPKEVPLCLYRIAQEGMKNIISHSGVKRCKVLLKGSDDFICLEVSDKGVGFDPVEVKDKPGLGLASMRERAQLVQGEFSIETEPESGTTIRVSIPLGRQNT